MGGASGAPMLGAMGGAMGGAIGGAMGGPPADEEGEVGLDAGGSGGGGAPPPLAAMGDVGPETLPDANRLGCECGDPSGDGGSGLALLACAMLIACATAALRAFLSTFFFMIVWMGRRRRRRRKEEDDRGRELARGTVSAGGATLRVHHAADAAHRCTYSF